MRRKRVTQLFPFLLPLRLKQRKCFFYLKMRFDRNKYSRSVLGDRLPYPVYQTQSLLLNENSGFDMRYQYNKVHNLRLAARPLDHLVIRPGETFSFWQTIRKADRREPYRDGLILSDGKITAVYGGGLCQLSNLLFWMFLHTPLTIVERHGHAVESFPSTTEELPCGTDATVNEGWLDLKFKNETGTVFQVEISFGDSFMYGSIFTDKEPEDSVEIRNKKVRYFKKEGKVFQSADVCKRITQRETHAVRDVFLYDNCCEIGYPLPDGTPVQEEDAQAEIKEGWSSI